MKETFYFTHDFTAFNDPKIQEAFMDHGIQAYGVYWYLIESLAQETERWFLPKRYDRIAFVLRIEKNVIQSIVEEYDLFVFDEKNFWNKRLDRHFNERAKKSEKAKLSVQKRWDNKKKENTNVLRSYYDRNTIKERKGKEIKEKEIKETHSNKFEEERIIFETFRKKYLGTKVGLDTEFVNFQKKTKDWREVLPLLENAIENQAKSRDYLKRLGKFVPEWKMLKTWINNRCWEEEGESVKPFLERSDEEHYEEYVSYDNPMTMFRAKNKEELPYRELLQLAHRLEHRLSADPKYK